MILQYRPTASLEVTYEMYKNHKGIKILNLVSPKTWHLQTSRVKKYRFASNT